MRAPTPTAALALVLVGAAAAGARADEPPAPPAPAGFAPVATAGAGFGAEGTWAVTVSSANTSSASVFVHKVSGGGYEINVHPAVDTFIVSNLSIGAVVGIDHTSGGGGTTVLDLGVRAGYDLAIADRVTIWPTAGIFVSHQSADHTSTTPASLGLFAPFLFHVVPHAVAGLGPSFNLGLNDGNGTELGVDFILGGWL